MVGCVQRYDRRRIDANDKEQRRRRRLNGMMQNLKERENEDFLEILCADDVLDEILYQKFLKLWKVRHCFN